MSAALDSGLFKLNRIPDNLLREPLEYLKADHVRQRRVCDVLEKLVSEDVDETAADVIEATIAYLSDDFLLHMRDEEIDLFPRLRVSCRLDDEIDGLLDGLQRDHTADEYLATGIVQSLRSMLDIVQPTDVSKLNQLAGSFAMTERRHLKLEDGIVLPIAKRRLSPDELEQIGRSMAARRNIVYPTYCE